MQQIQNGECEDAHPATQLTAKPIYGLLLQSTFVDGGDDGNRMQSLLPYDVT